MSSKYGKFGSEIDPQALDRVNVAAASAHKAEKEEEKLAPLEFGAAASTFHAVVMKVEPKEDEYLTDDSELEAEHSGEDDSPDGSDHGFIHSLTKSEEETDDDSGSVLFFNLQHLGANDNPLVAVEKFASFLVQQGVIKTYKTEQNILKIKTRSPSYINPPKVGQTVLPITPIRPGILSSDSSPQDLSRPITREVKHGKSSTKQQGVKSSKSTTGTIPKTTSVLDTTLNLVHTFETISGRIMRLAVKEYCKDCPPSTRATKLIWYKHLKQTHNNGVVKTLVY
ncbi:phosphoprotein [Xinjiang tick rhabdovirus]|uniref:Phosphoprotein n=1 Tax=Xinjiang tick rhabdovirus TaxID=2560016 RepID=A0A482LUV3_9RHAB|nr:phosphoprotein [Xinjiang tick rhabdovirus]QBQ65043.1 phosphoprotein [Xinjiang tick rhabdovirus]